MQKNNNNKNPAENQSLCYIQMIFKSLNTLVWYAVTLLFLSDIHAKKPHKVWYCWQIWDNDKKLSLSTELMPLWWQRAPEELCRTQNGQKDDKWTSVWIVDICRLIHLLENILSHIHTMLTNDWRKIIQQSLLTDPYIQQQENPSKTLGIMRKDIEKKTVHIYTTLVYPRLKYFWSLHLKNRL